MSHEPESIEDLDKAFTLLASNDADSVTRGLEIVLKVSDLTSSSEARLAVLVNHSNLTQTLMSFAFSTDSSFRHLAMKTLNNLTKSAAAKVAYIAKGILPPLLAACTRTDSEQRCYAAEILTSLCEIAPNQHLFRQNGGMQVLIGLAQQDANCQRFACAIIVHMLTTDTNCKHVTEADGMNVISRLVYSGSTIIRRAAAALLALLFSDPLLAQNVIQSGGVALLLHLSRSNDQQLQGLVVSAFATLSHATSGGAYVAAEALLRLCISQQSDAQLFGIGLLAALATVPAFAVALAESGSTSKLVQIYAMASDLSVKRYVLLTMERMAEHNQRLISETMIRANVMELMLFICDAEEDYFCCQQAFDTAHFLQVFARSGLAVPTELDLDSKSEFVEVVDYLEFILEPDAIALYLEAVLKQRIEVAPKTPRASAVQSQTMLPKPTVVATIPPPPVQTSVVPSAAAAPATARATKLPAAANSRRSSSTVATASSKATSRAGSVVSAKPPATPPSTKPSPRSVSTKTAGANSGVARSPIGTPTDSKPVNPQPKASLPRKESVTAALLATVSATKPLSHEPSASPHRSDTATVPDSPTVSPPATAPITPERIPQISGDPPSPLKRLASRASVSHIPQRRVSTSPATSPQHGPDWYAALASRGSQPHVDDPVILVPRQMATTASADSVELETANVAMLVSYAADHRGEVTFPSTDHSATTISDVSATPANETGCDVTHSIDPSDSGLLPVTATTTPADAVTLQPIPNFVDVPASVIFTNTTPAEEPLQHSIPEDAQVSAAAIFAPPTALAATVSTDITQEEKVPSTPVLVSAAVEPPNAHPTSESTATESSTMITIGSNVLPLHDEKPIVRSEIEPVTDERTTHVEAESVATVNATSETTASIAVAAREALLDVSQAAVQLQHPVQPATASTSDQPFQTERISNTAPPGDIDVPGEALNLSPTSPRTPSMDIPVQPTGMSVPRPTMGVIIPPTRRASDPDILIESPSTTPTLRERPRLNSQHSVHWQNDADEPHVEQTASKKSTSPIVPAAVRADRVPSPVRPPSPIQMQLGYADNPVLVSVSSTGRRPSLSSKKRLVPTLSAVNDLMRDVEVPPPAASRLPSISRHASHTATQSQPPPQVVRSVKKPDKKKTTPRPKQELPPLVDPHHDVASRFMLPVATPPRTPAPTPRLVAPILGRNKSPEHQGQALKSFAKDLKANIVSGHLKLDANTT
eukprot:TRINITY_DN10217_c0_g2_i1.p1 TRINITY_DN10217_c0_g2~~TRINITY_DN10217_c0_g2_i1.p1  ORF type:complete len:1225 (-),score=249.54 TRINITY_DN10217_c0_g2_i1:2524-6198(-)